MLEEIAVSESRLLLLPGFESISNFFIGVHFLLATQNNKIETDIRILLNYQVRTSAENCFPNFKKQMEILHSRKKKNTMTYAGSSTSSCACLMMAAV
jgi:hypothetical protein